MPQTEDNIRFRFKIRASKSQLDDLHDPKRFVVCPPTPRYGPCSRSQPLGRILIRSECRKTFAMNGSPIQSWFLGKLCTTCFHSGTNRSLPTTSHVPTTEESCWTNQPRWDGERTFFYALAMLVMRSENNAHVLSFFVRLHCCISHIFSVSCYSVLHIRSTTL